jgi:nitrogen fixation NifU-like protein
MPPVEDLYQEIILEHNKHPRNFGMMEDATATADGNNPLCGDEVKVLLKVEDDRILDLKFTGQGCAISKASASIMTEALIGKSTEEAKLVSSRVLGSLQGKGGELELETDGDIASLYGVRKFPARLKCATLAWHAFEAALSGKGSVSTESER